MKLKNCHSETQNATVLRCKNKIIIGILSIFLAFSVQFSTVKANTAYTGMRKISSMEIVSDMGVGWNLGNTLDANGPDETYWGNPFTTKPMIDEIAKKGFKTLRLPVTWSEHLGDAPDYKVEEAWLDRVEEVANYGLANDMYVIVNIHHDESWLIPTYERLDIVTDKLGKLWTQIAGRFKNYGDYVIFETINEPRHKGTPEEWIGGTVEGRDCVNKFHKACVDAIRATGGNNATRHLMIAPYGASSSPVTTDALIIPNNDTNTIVSIHSYFPYQFCLGKETSWGTDEEKQAMSDEFDRIYMKFSSKGIPVVLGEWCATNNNNLADRVNHTKHYAQGSVDRGFCPIWWDIGAQNGSGLLDRNTLTWFYPEIANEIVNVVPDTTPTSKLTINNGTPSGIFKEGSKVNIQANSPQPGYVFKTWIGQVANVADVLSFSTSIVIPTNDVTLNATYEKNISACISTETIIEAEDYLSMMGVIVDSSSDSTGNIGYIDASDWVDYCIDIPIDGDYELDLCVASDFDGGLIEIQIDGETKTTVEIFKTGGWSVWKTLTSEKFNIAAGLHTLRLYAKNGGWNLDWIQVNSKSVDVTGISIFPTSKSLNIGETIVIVPSVSPVDATNKAVTWSSDNISVATVDNSGLVTALDTGSVTISAITKVGGFTAQCSISVIDEGNGGRCSNPVNISVPFVQKGAGEFCWFTNQKPSYINSWNLNMLLINGIDFTNKWTNSMPAIENGGWTIEYSAKYDWSHFEASLLKSAPLGRQEKLTFIEVYPIPFKEELNIALGNPKEVIGIELFNIQGQKIKEISSSEISHLINLQVNSLSSVYILRVKTTNDMHVKMLINK